MARLTVEFPDEVTQMLEKLAKGNGTTKRDVIRRALALYNHLYEHGVRPGGDKKLSITDQADKIERDIIFTA